MNIAIWGMGVSGLSALKFIKTCTDNAVLAISQGNPLEWKDREKVLGIIDEKDCFDQSKLPDGDLDLDLIILSPGIPPDIPELQPFKKIKKICEVEYAFNHTKQPIIAVTGTNGKTSTVTMITKALELAGKKVFLGGNIGTPFCEILMSGKSYDFIVLELSSFQLELLDKFHAHIAVVLNITKSHMERYSSFEDYRDAKYQIVMNQTQNDYFISDKLNSKLSTPAKSITIKPTSGIDFSKSKLVGEHNQLNVDVVFKVLTFLNIKTAKNIVQNLVNEFSGVKYRLEYLREFNGVEFYNDAKSTNSASTLSAATSFSGKRVVLILGGKLRDKSQDLIGVLSGVKEIKLIYAVGDSKDYIENQLSGQYKVIKKRTLKDVFSDNELMNFDIVLFSPGFPSFDQYRNYIERAQDFENLVLNLT